jgi:copper chaperone NosL
MTKDKISLLSRILLALTSVSLLVSVFVPIWRIELSAPQYPEGLVLLICADKLSGSVDIINGLNHYIGMQTLHADNFIEFTILPYIIGAYALFAMLTAVIGRKKILYVLFGAFILFGIVAMVDFWRWEYNYGHNLDPKAAIVVPGMAYQPPLIGFKQLLNFGAYSVPDIGGWLFVGSGVLMLTAVLYETGLLRRKEKISPAIAILIFLCASVFMSCSGGKAEPVRLNKDQCDNCKMTISDGKFACEILTDKGKTLKFDDLGCLFNYKKANPATIVKSYLVGDYTQNNQMIDAAAATYFMAEGLNSPMGGNMAAFKEKADAASNAQKFNAPLMDWKQLNE